MFYIKKFTFNMFLKIKEVIKNLINQLYPEKCMLCGKNAEDFCLCKTCLKTLKFSTDSHQRIINSVQIYSPFFYKDKIQKLILNYKFKHKKSLYKLFSKLLFDYFNYCELKNILNCENTIIVGIPSYKDRKNKRGYKHIDLIIEEFSKLSNIPYSSKIIEKIKYTKPQHNLTYKERYENIKNSFRINPENIKKTNILIIDDIVTSGATANEIINLFKTLENINIYFLSLSVVEK